MYKIPFRRIYCDTFKSYIKELIWVFVVIKIFPNCHNFESDALRNSYINNPTLLYEQLEHHLLKIKLY